MGYPFIDHPFGFDIPEPPAPTCPEPPWELVRQGDPGSCASFLDHHARIAIYPVKYPKFKLPAADPYGLLACGY